MLSVQSRVRLPSETRIRLSSGRSGPIRRPWTASRAPEEVFDVAVMYPLYAARNQFREHLLVEFAQGIPEHAACRFVGKDDTARRPVTVSLRQDTRGCWSDLKLVVFPVPTEWLANGGLRRRGLTGSCSWDCPAAPRRTSREFQFASRFPGSQGLLSDVTFRTRHEGAFRFQPVFDRAGPGEGLVRIPKGSGIGGNQNEQAT